MRTIEASEFEIRCLQLMDEVTASGEQLVITRSGKPVSLLSPYPSVPVTSLFGRHRDALKIRGDVVAPIGEPWDAEH
jgi:antitoxin (DNA-binding transcriptional repressor) of toxin-antitoxin stability system